MTLFAMTPPERRTRPRRHHHPDRLADVAPLSLVGIVGSPAETDSGTSAGTVSDLIVRWDSGDIYPAVVAVLVRAGRTRTGVPIGSVTTIGPDAIVIRDASGSRPEREDGLVALAHDVLDRQLVDAAGIDIVRVSDLVLAPLPDGLRLIGVDVSARTFLRRLGPRRLRQHVAPRRVIDWASVGAFSVRGAGEAGSVLRLTPTAAQLRELDPAELETLVDDLAWRERHQLVAAMGQET
jgi:sporulation protein YlmC with PRC-barrel domain